MFMWDDRTTEQLQALWLQGHSGAEIAAAIGSTRSAVLGKARRLDLTMRKDWPKEREAQLRVLWADPSLSMADIGKTLGIGRSAVAGKISRLMLPHRTHASFRRTNISEGKGMPLRIRPKTVSATVAKPPARVVVAPGKPVPLMDLEHHHCRWLQDDGLFCGNQKERGSYCSGHAAITYVADAPKVRRMFVGRPSVNAF